MEETRLVPFPKSDDDVVLVATPFCRALARAAGATARFDGVLAAREYVALARVADALADLATSSSVVGALVLSGALSDTSYEHAMKALADAAASVDAAARSASFRAMRPLLEAQTVRAKDVGGDWAEALRIADAERDEVLSGIAGQATSSWLGDLFGSGFTEAVDPSKETELDRAKRLAATWADPALGAAVAAAQSGAPGARERLGGELLQASQRALAVARATLRDEATVDDQLRLAERFLALTTAFAEQLELRLRTAADRMKLQSELFREDLDEFVEHSLDKVEIAMRDLAHGREDWTDETLWKQFAQVDAFRLLKSEFEPLKKRYERLFAQWNDELKAFTHELEGVVSGVLESVDPKVFAQLVPTEHADAALRNRLDRVAQTCLQGASAVGVAAAGAAVVAPVAAKVVLVAIGSSAALGPVALAVGAVLGTGIAAAAAWKYFSNIEDRKRDVVREKREVVREGLARLIAQEGLRHDETARAILERFVAAARGRYLPLVLEARAASMRARLEGLAIRRILADARGP